MSGTNNPPQGDTTINSEDKGASATPKLAKQPSVSKSLTVEEAYRRGVIDATGGFAIPNLMNHQKSRNTAFKKYAIKFFNTKIKERRERLLGAMVTDLPTTDRNANTDAANAQQIAQEANKARIDELERIPRTRSKQAYIENRLKALTSEKGSA